MGPVGPMVVSGGPRGATGPGSVGSSGRMLGTVGVHGGRGGVCAGIWGHGEPWLWGRGDSAGVQLIIPAADLLTVS